MAEKMIGAGLKDIVQGRRAAAFGAAQAGRVAALDRQGRPFRRRRSTTSASPCGPARSSASPASPATARTRCSIALSGESPRRRQGCDHARRQAARRCSTRPARRKRGLCARARGAQRPRRRRRLHARRQFRAHGARPARHGGRWADQLGRGQDLRRQGHRRLRRQGAGAGLDRGLAVGRQPAEIHHGPRDPAEADACWWSRQPTWGVDAGAAAAIHQALVDLAAAGSAIVVISQDLDELLALCDTLAVINDGRLSAHDEGRRGQPRRDRPADGRRPRHRRRSPHPARSARCRSGLRSAPSPRGSCSI